MHYRPPQLPWKARICGFTGYLSYFHRLCFLWWLAFFAALIIYAFKDTWRSLPQNQLWNELWVCSCGCHATFVLITFDVYIISCVSGHLTGKRHTEKTRCFEDLMVESVSSVMGVEQGKERAGRNGEIGGNAIVRGHAIFCCWDFDQEDTSTCWESLLRTNIHKR